MGELFHAIVFAPIYNALALSVSVIPGGDLGVAMIVVTVLVRVLLFPLSLAATRAQVTMQELSPKLEQLRTEHKDNQEELARRTMALFKEHKVNPLASIFLLLVQIPVIIGLYLVFLRETKDSSFDPTILYSFITAPDSVSFLFLGVVDLAAKSIPLALLVAVSQFFFAKLTMPAPPASKGTSFKDDLSRSMHVQMRYVFPFIVGFIAYVSNGAVALYFLVSNIFSIAQTLVVKRIHKTHGPQ